MAKEDNNVQVSDLAIENVFEVWYKPSDYGT